MSPMPDADELRRAAEALDMPASAIVTPRALLDAAIAWLGSDAPRRPDALINAKGSTLLGVLYQSPVDAIDTAFQAFGLPVAVMDYSEWMESVGGSDAMESGAALSAGDARALTGFLCSVQRGERFCAGFTAAMIEGGGMLAAARLLADMIDRGEWTPQWN